MEGVYTLKDCDLAPLVVKPDRNMIYSPVPEHLSDVDLSLVFDPSWDFSCLRIHAIGFVMVFLLQNFIDAFQVYD